MRRRRRRRPPKRTGAAGTLPDIMPARAETGNRGSGGIGCPRQNAAERAVRRMRTGRCGFS
ncbi:hypothetical protein DIE12_01260 [Burkholderia sp. Bp9015]|nr:hypothetical protein DIE20_01130 [Burkholderia sp. Bp9131]RQR79746.1 hypothetical protein DIE12_01260 [Burkholderia sp. Bp9015]